MTQLTMTVSAAPVKHSVLCENCGRGLDVVGALWRVDDDSELRCEDCQPKRDYIR